MRPGVSILADRCGPCATKCDRPGSEQLAEARLACADRASDAAGEGLPMIGKLLGHTQARTTARYAHLAADPVRAATERVGAALVGMMRGESADVVSLNRNKS